MTANLTPRMKNYLGEYTTAELARLPVEKVRRWNWVWNISNTRPEIYDGAAWVPFGGGAAGGVDTQNSGVPVDTPALTINFRTGLAAVATGASTTAVDNSGVLSVANQGSPQLTGNVTVSQGANVTITQVGNNIQIAAAGGGVSGSGVEKPDDYHYFKVAGTGETSYIPETGMSSQRCIARSATYSNTYYLFSDVYHTGASDPAADHIFILRIEHLTDAPGTKSALDRCVWDVEIEVDELYTGELIVQPKLGDCCLTIDDDDMLHIIYTAETDADQWVRVLDAYVSIPANTELQEPTMAGIAAPPAPMSITVLSEIVSVTGAAGFECDHPSAAFTPNNTTGGVGGSALFVIFRQDADPFGEIHVNIYDPLSPAGTRYMAVPETPISLPGANANYPTIEMGMNGAYAMWTQAGGAYFGVSAGFDMTVWQVSAVPISAVIVGAPDTDDPMSVVVATCAAATDFIYVAISNNTGQGERYLVVFAEDFLTTGVGATYQISLFDTNNTAEAASADVEGNKHTFFQLGISKITWAANEEAPVLFYSHVMIEGFINTRSFDNHMAIIVPDSTDGFIVSDLPIKPAAASTYAALGAILSLIDAKIHFAYYEYNRVWANTAGVTYIYYPLMVIGSIELRYSQPDIGTEPQTSLIVALWMKDVPEYPYLSDHGVYGC